MFQFYQISFTSPSNLRSTFYISTMISLTCLPWHLCPILLFAKTPVFVILGFFTKTPLSKLTACYLRGMSVQIWFLQIVCSLNSSGDMLMLNPAWDRGACIWTGYSMFPHQTEQCQVLQHLGLSEMHVTSPNKAKYSCYLITLQEKRHDKEQILPLDAFT